MLQGERNERLKPDYGKREHQETERSLAIEKHRMNLAQLENERRKAFITGKPERMEERRPESNEHERPSSRTREEEMRRNWELENRKRKLEQPEVQLPPHARAQVDMNKRITEKSHHMPDELAMRKEQYLAMYARQHEGYGMPGVPYPDRARSAGNPPFYMGRMGSQAEVSVTEALRKQREYNEKQEAMRKMANQERGMVDSGEPAKKRLKTPRCMCGVCGKEASFLCSGCQKAWYCSAKCQVRKPYLQNNKELKQVTFLSDVIRKSVELLRMANDGVSRSNQENSLADVVNLQQELLTPSFAICNDSTYFQLAYVTTNTSLAYALYIYTARALIGRQACLDRTDDIGFAHINCMVFIP